MQDKPKLAFVDDEPFFVGSYLRELQNDFNVIYFHDPATAVQAIRDDDSTEVLVTEILMPTPNAAVDEAGGFEGGYWLLDQLKPDIAARGIRVTVLTQMNVTNVQERIAQIGLPAPLIRVLGKSLAPAFALPRILQTHVAGARDG